MNNTNLITIRDARAEDADVVVNLIIEAIEDLSNIFAGTNDQDVTRETFIKYFKEEQGKFSHKQGIVAEVDGIVVGSIMGYIWDDVEELDMQQIKHIENIYRDKPRVCKEYVEKIKSADEAFEGEYYIDNLAVVSEYRGLKISSLLIKEVEKRAEAMGNEKVSILADVLNEKAYEIYKKKGYKKDCEKDVLGHKYHHLVKIL
jgi:ribosomal protein S18 acetylase RimI-like enzyme